MTVSKKYMNDRVVLLLLSINAFFAALVSMWVLLRLNADKTSTYIVGYNSANRLSPPRNGTSLDILAFIAFALFQLTFNVLLSIKVYNIRRYFAIGILSMTLLLLVVTLIVSNALLITR